METVGISIISKASSYRPEIDGLRGMAIILVLCYHFFGDLFKGGFIGVDVFFVISGFLIGRLFKFNDPEESFSRKLLVYYSNRIRRIVPGVSVVLALTVVVGYLTFYPHELTHLGKHVIGSALFGENILLNSESGYFDLQIEKKVLAHLWSLGVEVQLYIFFPLLFLIFRNNVSRLFLGVIICLSVTLIATKLSPSAAFYLPIFRLWQFLAGVLVNYLPERRENHSPIFGLLSLLSAILLIAFSLLFKDLRSYPGAWSLIPTLAAVALIVCKQNSFFNRNILCSSPMRFIGSISYPLYLTHWPILVVARLWTDNNISPELRGMLVILSFIMSWGIWRLVERPYNSFTNKYSRRAVGINFLMLFSFICVFCILGFWFVTKSKDLRNPFFGVSIELPSNNNLPNLVSAGCVIPIKDLKLLKTEEVLECYSDPDDQLELPANILVGDSHAYSMASGLFLNTPKGEGWRVAALHGCPSIEGIKVKEERGCYRFNTVVFENIRSSKEIKVVAIYNAYFRIFSEQLYEIDSLGSGEVIINKVLWQLKRTIKSLIESGKTVIFILDNPNFDEDPFVCFSNRFGKFRGEQNRCKQTLSEWHAKSSNYRLLVEQLKSELPDVLFYDSADALCANQQCFMFHQNESLYLMDGGHLSSFGSNKLAEHFLQWLKRKINK